MISCCIIGNKVNGWMMLFLKFSWLFDNQCPSLFNVNNLKIFKHNQRHLIMLSADKWIWSAEVRFLPTNSINFRDAGSWDFTHTNTVGSEAWWLLTLPRVVRIKEIRIYDRVANGLRINGVTVWIGIGLTGGNYDGATKVGTIRYNSDSRIYIYSDLDVAGSSVAVQGPSNNNAHLSLSEVEVYATAGG